MGHPVEIFTSSPPESCICAVCTDVLQDAVAFKECGHTFCNECAAACLPSNLCPTCRTEVTCGSIPIFTLRELIGSMEVKCPRSNDAGMEDRSGKKAKANDGKAVPVSHNVEGCGWIGKCLDVLKHEAVCDFKVVKCSVEGCNHECRKRDMCSHLSGEGFIHHMTLMKQSITQTITTEYEKFIEDKVLTIKSGHENDLNTIKANHSKAIKAIKQSISSRYEKKINNMKNEITEMKQQLSSSDKTIESIQKEMVDLKSKQSEVQQSSDKDKDKEKEAGLNVEGCGIAQINGTYKQFGEFNGAPKYSKMGMYSGKEVKFEIFRYAGVWCIFMLGNGKKIRLDLFFRPI